MNLHQLRPAKGSKHARKRLGRGPGSGTGKTAGRGEKGQKSRSGHRRRPGFEGGQMPLVRRVPKRGFTNVFRTEYSVINLARLAKLPAGEQEVTPDGLAGRGWIHPGRPLKVLGAGELRRPLRVTAHRFSKSARAKIEAAGGSCEELES